MPKVLEDSDHRRQKGHLLSHTTDSGEHWSPLWGMHQPDQDVLGPYLISEAALRKAWELRGMQDWGQVWQPSGQRLSAWGKEGSPSSRFPTLFAPCLPLHLTLCYPHQRLHENPRLFSSAFVSLCLSPSLLLSPSVFSAAAAKSRQSCPTLCHPIDGSPRGSAVHEILSTWSISLFKRISNPLLPHPLPATEWLCEHVSSGLSIPSCSRSLSSCLHASLS